MAMGFGSSGSGGGVKFYDRAAALGTGRNSEQPAAQTPRVRATINRIGEEAAKFAAIRSIYSKVGRSGNWFCGTRPSDPSPAAGKCRASSTPMASTPAIEPAS